MNVGSVIVVLVMPCLSSDSRINIVFPQQSVTSPNLPSFQELIFEDFSQFILVENVFEEVVLQSVTKDIMMGEWWTCMETLACHR